MYQSRNIASKYDKETEDEQLASHINVIDMALHGSRDPLLKDPTWARQNEINKSSFAKVNQIEQVQDDLFHAQDTFRKAVTADFLRLRNAVLENSANGDAARERLKKEQTMMHSDNAARSEALSQEAATMSTVLESNVRAVDALQEAYQIMRSEFNDVAMAKTSFEKRLDSVEALLRDVSDNLSEMLLKMERMAMENEVLQEE